MSEIVTTAQLLARGFDTADLQRLTRTGALQRIRRGAYGLPQEAGKVEDRHRRMIAATVSQLENDAVFSYGSAAVLHGLPVWEYSVESVHLTRPRIGGGRKRSLVEVHTSPLTDDQLVMIGSLAATSLARTVVDLARTLPFEQAVAAGDRAMALGLNLAELEPVLEGAAGWPGIRQARRVAGFLDRRSESAAESVSRVRFADDLLPAPTPQYEVFDDLGYFVARADFGWEEQRVLGEFDGEVKYEELLRPNETVKDVLLREKRREQALRDLGWEVVRWVWAELYQRGVIRDRLLRAFARTAKR